jgi:hypothetical protein
LRIGLSKSLRSETRANAPRLVPTRQVFSGSPLVASNSVLQGKFNIGFASLPFVGTVTLDRRNDGSNVAFIEVRNYQGRCVLPTIDGKGIIVSTRANSANLEADIKKELTKIPSQNLIISLDPSTRGAGTYRASNKPSKKV